VLIAGFVLLGALFTGLSIWGAPFAVELLVIPSLRGQSEEETRRRIVRQTQLICVGLVWLVIAVAIGFAATH
jgi:hypothetical protein